MPIPPRVRIALLAGLLCARPAFAEPPAGDYSIDVATPRIFVPMEIPPPPCFALGLVDLCVDGFTVPLTTFGSGQIGSLVYAHMEGDLEGEACVLDDEGTPLPAPACIRGGIPGEVTGSAKRPRAVLEPTFDGVVSFGGIPLRARAGGRLRCRADSALASMPCRGPLTVCASEASGRTIGCASEKVEITLPLEGGAWQLRLIDLTTDAEGAVEGAAEVELANGLIAVYGVTGQYDAEKDRASLLLVGGPGSTGSTLELTKLVLSASTATSGKIAFRIAGQSGKVKLGGAP